MAKKKTPLEIKSMADAEKALAELEDIMERIQPLERAAVEIKKAVTDYAVAKKVDVIQLDGAYYRQINRSSSKWIATDDEIPETLLKKAKSLRSIVRGKTVRVKGKNEISLWNFITKRVVDPEAIDSAVSKGWIKESEIKKAFVQSPQKPFLQRYVGEAD